jgi:hypothetical protein
MVKRIESHIMAGFAASSSECRLLYDDEMMHRMQQMLAALCHWQRVKRIESTELAECRLPYDACTNCGLPKAWSST